MAGRSLNSGWLSVFSFVHSARVFREGSRLYCAWVTGVRPDSCQVIILISYSW